MSTFNTCDLMDANEDKAIQVIAPSIDGQALRHYGGKSCFFGQIVTVKCHEDNSRVKELFATAGHGRVLVVDGGGSLRCALLGDMIAKSGMDNGWAGIIIYGALRDVADLGTMNIGAMALASTPKKSVRKGVGEVGITLSFGGVSIRDGDYLYADQNGVILSSSPLL